MERFTRRGSPRGRRRLALATFAWRSSAPRRWWRSQRMCGRARPIFRAAIGTGSSRRCDLPARAGRGCFRRRSKTLPPTRRFPPASDRARRRRAALARTNSPRRSDFRASERQRSSAARVSVSGLGTTSSRAPCCCGRATPRATPRVGIDAGRAAAGIQSPRSATPSRTPPPALQTDGPRRRL